MGVPFFIGYVCLVCHNLLLAHLVSFYWWNLAESALCLKTLHPAAPTGWQWSHEIKLLYSAAPNWLAVVPGDIHQTCLHVFVIFWDITQSS